MTSEQSFSNNLINISLHTQLSNDINLSFTLSNGVLHSDGNTGQLLPFIIKDPKLSFETIPMSLISHNDANKQLRMLYNKAEEIEKLLLFNHNVYQAEIDKHNGHVQTVNRKYNKLYKINKGRSLGRRAVANTEVFDKDSITCMHKCIIDSLTTHRDDIITHMSEIIMRCIQTVRDGDIPGYFNIELESKLHDKYNYTDNTHCIAITELKDSFVVHYPDTNGDMVPYHPDTIKYKKCNGNMDRPFFAKNFTNYPYNEYENTKYKYATFGSKPASN